VVNHLAMAHWMLFQTFVTSMVSHVTICADGLRRPKSGIRRYIPASNDNFWVLNREPLNKTHLYRVSQEECSRLRESVPYVKVYRYNPKHLCPKLNCYGNNGQRKVWSSCGSTHCTCQPTILTISVLECGVI